MVAMKVRRPGPANKRNGLGNEMRDCDSNERVRGHRGIFMIDVGMRRTGRQARISVLATKVGAGETVLRKFCGLLRRWFAVARGWLHSRLHPTSQPT